MNDKFFKGLAVGCIATLIITLTAVTLVQNSRVVDSKSLSTLNAITAIIEKEYYGEWTKDDIRDGIFAGSCFNLDAYSSFLTYEDYEDAIDPDQHFGGVGVRTVYNKYTKVYVVDYVYPGGPADRAGLKRKDIIMAVDEIDTYGLEMDTMSDMIRGEPGTVVTLKIDRDDETIDLDITREVVDIPNAWPVKLSDEVGYIRILAFNGRVAEEFKSSLDELGDIEYLIIDLRSNSGGVVGFYKDIMEVLVPSCVLQTAVRKDGSREELVLESDLTAPAYKFAVLCDPSTASCAEAMTQALKDLADAVVVGEETFGKGVMQEYFVVDKNSVLRLTVGVVESPNGVVWNGDGITPDIELKYEYLGDDFEESDLMMDNQVLAAYNALVGE